MLVLIVCWLEKVPTTILQKIVDKITKKKATPSKITAIQGDNHIHRFSWPSFSGGIITNIWWTIHENGSRFMREKVNSSKGRQLINRSLENKVFYDWSHLLQRLDWIKSPQIIHCQFISFLDAQKGPTFYMKKPGWLLKKTSWKLNICWKPYTQQRGHFNLHPLLLPNIECNVQ